MSQNPPLETLHLSVLPRISPSRFTALKSCVLREACVAAKQSALLPTSPKAKLGSVAHRLLELAGRGELANNYDLIAGEWDSLVAKVEMKMGTSLMERRWIPLRDSVADYYVRRSRACNAAQSVAVTMQNSHEKESTPASSHEKAAFEQQIATPSGSIGGVVDCLLPTPQGWILRDYKTGPIVDTPAGSAIKNDYQIQLKLYAAIFWSQKGYWPAKLELVPLANALNF